MTNLTEEEKLKLKEEDKKEFERKTKERIEYGKQETQRRYNDSIDSIPARYRNVSIDIIPQEILDGLKSKGSIYLWGDCGVGKTYIGYALLKRRLNKNLESAMKKIEEGHDGYYAFNRDVFLYNWPSILQEIKNSMDSKEESYSIKDYDSGIVILDDIGAEKFSDWSIEQLYEIVNNRYENMKPTIFISNLSLKELAGKVGDRIPSRIAEMCEVVKLEGKDRRLENLPLKKLNK